MAIDDDIHGPGEGMTPEMQKQFDDMQTADHVADSGGMGTGDGAMDNSGAASDPAAGDGAAGGAGGDAAAVAAAAAAKVAEGADDDGDDDGADDGTAAAGAGEGTPGPDGKKRKTPRVNVKRLDEERERANGLQTTLEAERLERARLEERLAIVAQAFNKKAKPAEEAVPVDDDPEPDAENDIFEHNKWLRRQVEKTNKRLEEFVGGQTARQTQDNENAELIRNYEADSRQYLADNPDFGAARQHLLQTRVLELAWLNFGKDLTAENAPRLTPQEHNQIAAAITNEEKQIVQSAFAARQSPSARIFQLAKMRGYRKAEPAGDKPAAGANGGAAPAAAAAAAANGGTPNAAEMVAKIREGAAASRSLSDGAGAVAEAFDAKKLANMPMDQFAKMLEGMESNEDLEKLFG